MKARKFDVLAVVSIGIGMIVASGFIYPKVLFWLGLTVVFLSLLFWMRFKPRPIDTAEQKPTMSYYVNVLDDSDVNIHDFHASDNRGLIDAGDRAKIDIRGVTMGRDKR